MERKNVKTEASRRKDLQAFEQLSELAKGKDRPRTQWLNLETKNAVAETKSRSSSSSSPLTTTISPPRSTIAPPSSPSPSLSRSTTSHHPSFLQETGKKDDRILETQTDESLRTLSQTRLRSLLTAQQTLLKSPLCKKLPDGGAKIQKKIAQIEAALQYVIHVDELVAGLDFNMSQLRLDEKTAEIKQPDMDDTLKALVAKKVQKLQKARTPYSQHSLAIELKPDGTFRGVAPKYRSGAPKFVSFAEAEQINRSTKLAIALQEKEQSSAVVGSQGSAFYSAHWHKPVDFSADSYREPASESEDEEEEDTEEEEDEDENEGDDPVGMHLQSAGFTDVLA